MKLSFWMRSIFVPAVVFELVLCSAVRGQTTMLASWDTAPTGSVFPGGDFDPTLDATATCSGCWRARNLATTPTTYSQSTTGGVTQGTGALQATIVGKGNGGEYSPTINGVPVMLDTHFDYPLVSTYSNNPAANGGVLDSRFTAIKNAVDGVNPGSFYTIEFDITYDVAQMRSIPWQPPEETVNPGPNGENRFPQRFFWIGMYGNANDGQWVRPDGQTDSSGFQFVGFDANTINPFDAQWNSNLLPVFHASFDLADFTFQPNSATTFYEFGFLYNSVFGTLPASSNTAGVHIYFDNFRLVEHAPEAFCDFTGDNMCTLADFQQFMAQHLVATPTLGDYDDDGDNDFLDFQEFERFYDLANLGSGTLTGDLAASGVPEPSTLALVGLCLLGAGISRARRFSKSAAVLAIGMATAFGQSSARAQIIDSFEVPPARFQPNPGAPPPSNPSVALSNIGVTHGTQRLKVTQAEDTIGDNNFVWLANTNPNWTTGDTAFDVLRNAVNIGAEHFNLMVDTTFRPQDLVDQGVNSLTVTLGLNFNGQTIGTYAGEMAQFTNTATIPLTNFNLPDVEDQGATSYSGNIGFTADAINVPFSVYIDNIRLVQISQPDLLTLEINRSNGAATLKNLTTNPVSWDYMEIKSPGASLDPVGWSSLDDQNADGPNTWIEAGGSSATALVEASIVGSHTLNPGATLPLGNLYNEAVHIDDLDLDIRRAAGPSFRTYDQLVTYIGVPPAGTTGDFNGNGFVDAADYVLWRNGGPLQNEGGVTPGSTTPEDYTTWRANFGKPPGSGTGTALDASGSVPEPSTLLMCISVVVAAWSGRRIRIV
jgi:PEP-CTERM motif